MSEQSTSIVAFIEARLSERDAIAKAAAAAGRAEQGYSRAEGEAGVHWVAHEGMVRNADVDADHHDADLWDNEGMDWRLVPEHVIAEHFAANDPAYVLADIQSKRRLLALHEDYRWRNDEGEGCYECDGICRISQALAAPFASHADFASSWALDTGGAEQ